MEFTQVYNNTTAKQKYRKFRSTYGSLVGNRPQVESINNKGRIQRLNNKRIKQMYSEMIHRVLGNSYGYKFVSPLRRLIFNLSNDGYIRCGTLQTTYKKLCFCFWYKHHNNGGYHENVVTSGSLKVKMSPLYNNINIRGRF